MSYVHMVTPVTSSVVIKSQGTQGPMGPQGLPGEIPEAPLDGKQYAREAGDWVSIVNMHVGPSPPANPSVGDIWIDTGSNR